MEAVKKKNGGPQMSLFQQPAENPPLREAIEFYKHKHNWSNRVIAGDSLLVMNSLLEKEGMVGQVQMAYFDPPYGIRYGSNFQPFVNKSSVSLCGLRRCGWSGSASWIHYALSGPLILNAVDGRGAPLGYTGTAV